MVQKTAHLENVKSEKTRKEERLIQAEPQKQILPNHPLSESSGIFKDEPLWDRFIEGIEEYRSKIDEQESIAE